MTDYNQQFLDWLEKVHRLDVQTVNDLPGDLVEEFTKLLLLADIPFRETYGDSPEGVADLLHMLLREEEFYNQNGEPLHIVSIETGRVFISPVNGLHAHPILFAEDDRNRCFAFQICDHRGPNVSRMAAIFDDLHDSCRKEGMQPEAFPELYMIYFSDCDLIGEGKPIGRIEFPQVTRTPEEWSEAGCDPDEPEPVMAKLHLIHCDVTQMTLQ